MKSGLMCAVMMAVVLVFAPYAKGEFRKSKFGEEKEEGASNRIALGARLYDEFSGLEDLKLEKNELSYQIFYEYHEGIGYWQIGGGYVPTPDDDRFDYMITPQINLILKDRIYRLGTGALKTYVKRDVDSTWTSLYWQIIAGLGFPLGDYVSLDIYAHYVFKSWKDIDETDQAAVDYSANIAISF